jgi:hypothetical protein
VSYDRWLPGEYEVIPNGVLVPESAPAGGREHRIVFVGRQEPRKGLHILLRAWPQIRRRSGLRLTVAGADPLAVRLLLTRLRISDEGIDVVGFLSQDDRHARRFDAKALVALSLGRELRMVLTRAFACSLPAVARTSPDAEVLEAEAHRRRPRQMSAPPWRLSATSSRTAARQAMGQAGTSSQPDATPGRRSRRPSRFISLVGGEVRAAA